MKAIWRFIQWLAMWPPKDKLKADIGCLGELGRIIHWSGAAFASNFLIYGFSAPLWNHGPDIGPAVILCVIIAVIIYLPARLLRRLMAGE